MRTQVVCLVSAALMSSFLPLSASTRLTSFLSLHDLEPRTMTTPIPGTQSFSDFWKGPRVSVVHAEEISTSQMVQAVIEEIRAETDAAIFLAGGASKMTAEDQANLLSMFGVLGELAEEGHRFVVGDGGTSEGIMHAAGKARRKSGEKFPLIGISPAPNVLPGGPSPEARAVSKYQPQIDHTDLIAIEPPAAWLEEQKSYGWEPSWGFWGAETAPMYDVFARLAEGKPSVTVVANGGGITYNEVKANLAQGRKVIAICGSGRVTDAICHELWGTDPSRAEKLDKVQKVPEGKTQSLVREHRALFVRVDMKEGPSALKAAISSALAK